ncbi:MAG: hypothetical protein RIQ38_1681 [Pseudomonadota bacterium]
MAMSDHRPVPETLPIDHDHWHLQATRCVQAADWAALAALCEQVLARRPNDAQAWHQAALAAFHQGRMADAVQAFERCLPGHPEPALVLSNLASARIELGDLDAAMQALDQAVLRDPQLALARNTRGHLRRRLRQPDGAREDLQTALRLAPGSADVLNNLGNLEKDAGNWAAAERCFLAALKQQPTMVHARLNLAEVLRKAARYRDALSVLTQTGADFVHLPRWQIEMALTLGELGQLDAALAHLQAAQDLRPDWEVPDLLRGNLLKDARRFDEAISAYQQVLGKDPNNANAHNNLANAYKDQGDLKKALQHYQQALRLTPDHANTWNNLGNLLKRLSLFDESVRAYREAFRLDPNTPYLAGMLAHMQTKQCDWAGLPQLLAHIEQGLQNDREVSTPFPLLGLLDRPDLHRKAAQIYGRANHPENPALGPLPAMAPLTPGRRLRVGYFSADLHNHATAYLMAQLFECHDRSRLEVHVYSYGPNQQDEMRLRIAAAAEHFHEVSGLADIEVARLARSHALDIAVDLKGYTQDARLGILAHRCAPLQLSYLGYPGTLALPYIDHALVDQVVVPQEARDDYTETLVWLAGCYQVNDWHRKIDPQVPPREDCGLPAQGFVFCCFNNSFKILPQTFAAWMRILQQVPGSVLWLLEDHPLAAGHLREQAQAQGVDPARLCFAPRAPLAQHLARHAHADLFLDTWPYNAHTTASDALWAGLPLLTLQGRSFAARVGASLLQALGLPELIAHTEAAYVQTAVRLAQSPTELATLRAQLREPDRLARVFDARPFVQRLETAYGLMVQRHLAQQALAQA